MSAANMLSKKSSLVIYAWLIVLTLAEVAIVALGIPKSAGAILMVGTTLAKVLMIGVYFMHLKYDRATAWLLPIIPVLLALFFVVALFPDLVYHLPLRFE